MMGLGRNGIVWSLAGLAASLPIPFINAGQMVILYRNVPEDMKGRIFAVRNAVQFSSIPLGILLGGLLADYVFEPFMLTQNPITQVLHKLVGEGAGSGMAVMFLCTGILGSLFSFAFYQRDEVLGEEEGNAQPRVLHGVALHSVGQPRRQLRGQPRPQVFLRPWIGAERTP